MSDLNLLLMIIMEKISTRMSDSISVITLGKFEKLSTTGMSD